MGTQKVFALAEIEFSQGFWENFLIDFLLNLLLELPTGLKAYREENFKLRVDENSKLGFSIITMKEWKLFFLGCYVSIC